MQPIKFCPNYSHTFICFKFQPAYQNLCHRVDGQVSSYLSDIRWGPDLNKNQLRENIRKFVNEYVYQVSCNNRSYEYL